MQLMPVCYAVASVSCCSLSLCHLYNNLMALLALIISAVCLVGYPSLWLDDTHCVQTSLYGFGVNHNDAIQHTNLKLLKTIQLQAHTLQNLTIALVT